MKSASEIFFAKNGIDLSPRFSEDELSKAYKQLAKKMHPDVGGTTHQFQELSRHYEMLLRRFS